MKSTSALITIAFALVLSAALPARPAVAQRGPCAADAQKFCGGLERASRKFCMKQHRDELSPACRTAREEKRDRRLAARGVPPRERAERACLRELRGPRGFGHKFVRREYLDLCIDRKLRAR